jgi:DNA-binding NarL/FixJ family response regulator
MTDRIRIGVVDDFQIVVHGVAAILAPFSDRVHVVETAVDGSLSSSVDIALYDSFAQGEANADSIAPLLDDPEVDRVVMYTWNFDEPLVDEARRRGLAGYLSKGLSAEDLVESLERVHGGEFVVDGRGRDRVSNPERTYPGQHDGLTEREAEVLALIAQGRSNAEIAELLFLSRDGTKSRIRRTYRRLGLRNRKDAIRWAISHGFVPD